MRITEFSAATGISARMLRHHHRRGHLVPSQVDASTGYRTYDPRQVPAARRLAALVRTGMDAAEAAELASDPRPEALAAHLSRVEDDLRLLRLPVAQVQSATEAWCLSPAFVLAKEVQVSVHAVADEVRRAKVELRSSTGRGPATFAATRRGADDAPPPTSVHVQLVDPRWSGEHVRARLVVPWSATRVAPAGWDVERLARRAVRVVDVGPLVDATLTDVLEAHRDLALAAAGDAGRARGSLWQFYDPTVTHLWVGHELVAGAP